MDDLASPQEKLNDHPGGWNKDDIKKYIRKDEVQIGKKILIDSNEKNGMRNERKITGKSEGEYIFRKLDRKSNENDEEKLKPKHSSWEHGLIDKKKDEKHSNGDNDKEENKDVKYNDKVSKIDKNEKVLEKKWRSTQT